LEIADWLRGLSLERYAETFRDNAIDVAVLPELRQTCAGRTTLSRWNLSNSLPWERVFWP